MHRDWTCTRLCLSHKHTHTQKPRLHISSLCPMDFPIYGQRFLFLVIFPVPVWPVDRLPVSQVCACVWGLTSDLWRRSSPTTPTDSGIRIPIEPRGTSRRWRMGWTCTRVPLDHVHTNTNTSTRCVTLSSCHVVCVKTASSPISQFLPE